MRKTRQQHSTRRAFLRGTVSIATGLLCLSQGVRVASGKAIDMTTKPRQGVAGSPPLVPNFAELSARIKAISNVFEVGGPQADYHYVEDLNDGRGYTVTSYGFCSATGEVAEIIRLYSALAPHTPLKRYLALMPPATDNEGTPAGFPGDWHKEVDSAALVDICEREADRLYYEPAMRVAQAAGIQSAIGRLVFYDTMLQHGGGDDPDSFSAILADARESVRTDGSQDETDLIRAFLQVRKGVLLDPSESDTRHVWRQSATRVDALLNLLDTNPELTPPITVSSSDVHIIVG